MRVQGLAGVADCTGGGVTRTDWRGDAMVAPGSMIDRIIHQYDLLAE